MIPGSSEKTLDADVVLWSGAFRAQVSFCRSSNMRPNPSFQVATSVPNLSPDRPVRFFPRCSFRRLGEPV